MNKEKKRCIYIWTNKITKKPYIGKTNNAKLRYNWFIDWETHYAGPHIDKARKKYNDIKYWDYKILCDCKDEDELNEKEKYFIALYNSNDKEKGYNISSGGTYGDTWYALSDEERNSRLERQSKTYKARGYKWMHKDDEQKLIDKNHQQEYLDNGWQYGLKKSTRQKLSESLKNSEKHKIACQKRRLSEEECARRGYIRKEKLEAYRQSQEYKDRIARNKEVARQRRIEYNKSEKHRQEAIASNKRRWKDGCPEETRNKMSKSLTGKAKNKIWMRKDDKTIMIKPEEYDEYISKGYIKGRGSNCPWNIKRKKTHNKN